MMKIAVPLAVSLFLSACGVEAGNPGTTKPDTKKGGVAIRIAKQLDLKSSMLSLSLSSFRLAQQDNEIAEISPNLKEINLFTNTTDDEPIVAESNDVPVGSYSDIIVQLASTDPVIYRDEEGRESPVDLDDPAVPIFKVNEEFEVGDGEKIEIVLNIDPYRSLIDEQTDKKRFKFRPQGHSHRRGRGLRYDGETSVLGASWVCAYAFDARPLKTKRKSRGHDESRDDTNSKKPRFLGERTIFDRLEDVKKDESKSCPNAFAVAPIVEAKYHLRQLIPATYHLRFFKQDGSYEDSNAPIKLRPSKKEDKWPTDDRR